MDKINELIEIKDAYSEQVNIREDFLDVEANLERMERYMPIKSHRKAFEKVATGLFERNNKRFYLLTGSYGTGKSHLSLMIANYLSNSSDAHEIRQFFENYRHMTKEDGQKEDSIDKFINIQKNKQYLVCICDYDSNDTFMEIVLKAILSALEREKIDTDQLVTPYREAVRKINEWEGLKADLNHDFIDKFVKLLARELPGTTLNQFKKGLEKELEPDKLKVFKKIHKEITTAEFVFERSNLVEIVKGLTESKIFKENFDGILILFDEFDYVLKNRSRFDLHVFQAFAEFCAKSFINGTPVITLAITHRSFVSYKNQYNDADFSVVNHRVEEISLATEGFEDIIAAIVIPKSNSDLWKAIIKPRRDIFNALTQSCQEYGIFNHLSDSNKKLRKKIIENIYPMHPMATYVLLELSKKIGANNRSVFTFFTKKNRRGEEGSYRWYIENTDILNGKKDLNFYTTDLIFDYFSTLITSDNTELPDSVRTIIRNFESSLREWKKLQSKEQKLFDDENDVLVDKILKVLVLFQLADVVTNSNNILFGLNANLYEDDRRKIESVLKYLVSNQILYHNRQSDSFEFRKSDLIDIDGTIENYISQEENFSINVVSELDRLAKNKDYKDLYDLFKENFIEGDSYNREWHEDKRFLRLFITLNDLESPKFYSDMTNLLVNDTNYKNSFEGIAVFVLCESIDECERAKDIANKNKNSKIIIAVPHEEIPLKEDIVRLIATESSFSKESLSEQESYLLSSKKINLAKIVADKIKLYLNSSKVKWYSNEGQLLNSNNRDETYAISHALEKVFSGKRTRIRRPELNKIHNVPKSVQKPIEEAVNRLLDWKSEIVWDVGKAKDTADIMFFKDVLVYANVIKTIEVKGTQNKGVIESDMTVVSETIPLLPKLIDCVNESKRGVSLNNLLKICDEHGVGYVAKMLLFATMIRYFAGSFYIKNTPQSTDTIEIQSFDVLEKYIIENKFPNSVIEILELTSEEIQLIADIYHIFNDVSLTTNVTLKQSYQALKDWYEGLPAISKLSSIYSEEEDIEFLNVMGTMNSVPMQTFLLSKLQIIVGADEKDDLTSTIAQKIVEKIRLFRMDIDKYLIQFKENICSRLANVFDINAVNSPYFSSGEIKNILMNWYNGLDDIQRDLNHSKHSLESKSFIKNLDELSISNNVDLIIFENLLNDFGLQKLLDWKTDKSADMIAIIKRVKQHIETEVVDVENPKVEFSKTWSKELENNETILYFNSEEHDKALSIQIPSENIVVYFTDNGKDPTRDQDRKEVRGNYKYIPLKDEITLKLVSMDNNGHFGNIITYLLKSKKKKFAGRIQVKESQLSLDDNYSEYESADSIFVPSIPTDYQSLEICLESIVEISRTRGKVSSDLIAKVLKNLIEKVN